MLKKLVFVLGLTSCLLMLSGCSTDLYDYDELNDRMDLFDKRLAELENWCKETNTNINSLKTLVESLLMHDVITGVTPVMKNDVLAGYTITFLKADPITIYHGEKGEKGEAGSNGVNGENGQDGEDGKDGQDGLDGYTPVIGVKQDADGVYYWTLDGEWLTDAQGNKVKAQGEKGIDGENGEDGTDGKDGKDAIAPQLKIENNYWYISYDGGKNWTQLDKAIGEDGEKGEDGEDGVDGDAFFDSVDTNNPNYVVFKLIGGTTFQLPTMTAFEALQSQCNVMNNNISALQTVVQALQETDYVVSVTPLMNDAVEIGYTLTFAKSGAVTIYHGKDGQDGQDGAPGTAGTPGKDGYSPQIGVKQHTDGIYYWTLDDNWLTDAQGNKVKAQGEKGDKGDKGETGATGSAGSAGTDGTPGENGITPKLKIDNGFWHVSYDNGETWTKMSEENATSGNNVFQSVTVTDGRITFVLNDNSTLVVPIYQEITIKIEEGKTGIAANEVIYIPYELTNATENTKVTVSSDGNYKAMVNVNSNSAGTIVVTAPSVYVDGFVNIHIDSGLGYSSFYVVNFYHQQMSFSKGLHYNVKPEGETIQVPLTTNFDYEVEIPNDVKSWIQLVEPRAVETRNETLTFTFDTNENQKAGRSASVGIVPVNAERPLYYITFNQASAYFSIDKTRFALKGEEQLLTVNIHSSLGLKIVENADWIEPQLSNNGTQYVLNLKVASNDTGSYRTHKIQLYEDESLGNTLLGEIEVIQISLSDEDSKAMIIEVSANPANGYTVTLPLFKDVDCVVDWGDGDLESITSTYPSHTYKNLTHAARYDVKIMGTVKSLRSETMNDVQRNGIFAVKQWGLTGLTSMNMAFRNCVNLYSVPADNTMAFSEVKDFGNCFSGCTALTNEGVPSNLFIHAYEAESFSNTFAGCSLLTVIPEHFFDNCSKVKDFSGVFNSTSIKTVPAELFRNCTEVENFTFSFYNCTSFETIPENLFKTNTKVKQFARTFESTAISSVPETIFDTCSEVYTFTSTFSNCVNLKKIGLIFKNNSKVTDYNAVFSDCENLEEIPEDLFKASLDVTRFNSTFKNCKNLKMIPRGIFDYNRKVSDFQHVFFGCINLEGESPYVVLSSGGRVHLYERNSFPEEFIPVTSHSQAFYNCKKLSDYANIPSGW